MSAACIYFVVHVVLYINVYDYVVGEATMTWIFAVYPQASGFPSQSSVYVFECCRKQIGLYEISLPYSSDYVNLAAFFV